MKIIGHNGRFLLFLAATLVGCGMIGDSAKKPSPLGIIVTPPSYYTTLRARYLGEKYNENLQRLVERVVQNPVTGKLQFANNIASVGGIGFFTHSVTKSLDERYLEVMLGVPDVFDDRTEFDSKLYRLFSEYGFELLSILASDSQIYKDSDVAGYGVNLSWRITAATPSGPRVALERGVVYVSKEEVGKFLDRQQDQNQLLARSVIFALQEEGPPRMVKYVPPGSTSAPAVTQRENREREAATTPAVAPNIRETELPAQKTEEGRNAPSVGRGAARETPAKNSEVTKRSEETKRQEEARQQEEATRTEAAKLAEAAKQEELKREEAARQAELARQQEEARKQEETAQQAELATAQAEAKEREESTRRAEEMRRQEEVRQQEEAKKAEAASVAEVARQEDLKRHEEARKREAAAKQAELAKRQEEARKQEEAVKSAEEAKRAGEVKRAEAVKKQEAEQLALQTGEPAPAKLPAGNETGEVKESPEKGGEDTRAPGATALAKPSTPLSVPPLATKQTTGTAYVVQLSFAAREEAQRWFDRLRQEGYPASMSLTGEGGPIRLRVGKFSSHGAASELLGRFKQQGASGIVIEAAN